MHFLSDMTKIQPIESKLHLEVLTADQLLEIKSSTLEVLESIGIRFPSERAIKVFAEHGASVDFDSQIVHLPTDMVLEAMSHAPRHYVLGSRREAMDLHLDGAHSYFATDGCGTQTVDFETGEQRFSCKEDVAKMARVADYLSSIAFYLADG